MTGGRVSFINKANGQETNIDQDIAGRINKTLSMQSTAGTRQSGETINKISSGFSISFSQTTANNTARDVCNLMIRGSSSVIDSHANPKVDEGINIDNWVL